MRVKDWTLEIPAAKSRLLVYATKTRKVRVAHCGELTTAAIEAYLETRGRVDGDDSLFLGISNRPLQIEGVDRMMSRRAAKAGLAPRKLHPHIWRKAFATYAAENGMDPTVLLALGGWSSMDMLRTYIQNNNRRIADMHARTSPVDNGLKDKDEKK